MPQFCMRTTEGTFASTDGRTLYKRAWLPDGAAKATLAIVHGYAEHSGRYARAGAFFSSRGYAVHAFDLRGHGRSEGERVIVRSFNEYLDDLDAFLALIREREGEKPLFLLGHSMGGAVVALAAVTRRPAVAGFVLTGAAIKPPAGWGPRRIVVEMFVLLGRLLPKLRLTKLDAATVSRDPAVVADYDADPLNYRGKIPLCMLRAMVRSTRVIAKRAPTITAPLLILHGSADQLADPEGGHALYERASSVDKTWKLYEGLYHEILNEPEQDLVMRDIATWLDAHVAAVDASATTGSTAAS